MKMKNKLFKATLFLLTLTCLVGCNKKEEMEISSSELWFPMEGGVQDIQITANCEWTISVDEGIDWVKIEPMSGKKDKVISVIVDSLGEINERYASFTITSAKEQMQKQVGVMQNIVAKPNLQSIANMVFGVSVLARWNVDYWGEVLEETYKRFEYDANDTATGYTMYFLQDGSGVQQDNQSQGETVYFLFSYEYDPETRIFHIEFETEGDEEETYNALVLVATEELFCFQHEFLPKQWERADMRKIGTINPNDAIRLRREATRRKGDGGIFSIE